MTLRNPLANVYGRQFIVRPPVPATCNKAGANYKSEVTHLEYYPRAAYDEWLSILDAIIASGGDAFFAFEQADERYLDRGNLRVSDTGDISDTQGTALGNLTDVMTGRVFTANGPWVVVGDGTLRAVMPNMLAHRVAERPYYDDLLAQIANAAGLRLEVIANPHRWEGMADVAVVGDRVILTYAVPGHYDAGTSPKSQRSCKAGVEFAADQVGVPTESRMYCELVYPHFHGDTVHFGAVAGDGRPMLAHYDGGLWGDGAARVRAAFAHQLVAIGKEDAVTAYAGNSRQVGNGVLVPTGVSQEFLGAMRGLGLTNHVVPLYELFGKAGGGPGCATLYMPSNLVVPHDAPFRYSVSRDAVKARRQRLPERLNVAPGFFTGKHRG